MQLDKMSVQNRFIIGGVIIAAIAVVLFFLLSDSDAGKARIVLRNSGDCPEIMMVLQPRDGGGNTTLVAGPGEEDTADVESDLVYDFEIIANNEGDATCIFSDDPESPNVDRGEVAIPAGSTQTFNIASVRRDAE